MRDWDDLTALFDAIVVDFLEGRRDTLTCCYSNADFICAIIMSYGYTATVSWIRGDNLVVFRDPYKPVAV